MSGTSPSRLSPAGWLLLPISGASIALMGPRASWPAPGEDFASYMTALAMAVQLLVSVWVLLTLVLVLAGNRSSTARRISAAIAPRILRALLITGVSGAVVVGPAFAGMTAPADDGRHVSQHRAPLVDGLPLPDRPWAHPYRVATATQDPETDPRHASNPRNESKAGPVVTVQPGDTLWSIAAQSLPADSSARAIATACEHWYHANRHVIGPDPDLIFPEMKLHPPQSQENS